MKILTRIEFVWDAATERYVVANFTDDEYFGPISLCTGGEEAAAASEGSKAAGEAVAADTAATTAAADTAGAVSASEFGGAGLTAMDGAAAAGATAADAGITAGMLPSAGAGMSAADMAAAGISADQVAATSASMESGAGAGVGTGTSGGSLPGTSSIGPGGTGLDSSVTNTLSDTTAQKAVADTTTEEFVPGADKVDPGVYNPPGTNAGASPTPSGWDSAINSAKTVMQGKTVKDAMDALAKYGPLALAGGNLMNNKALSQKYAQKMGNVGQTQNAVAQQQIADAQAGKINASDQASIDQWKQGAIAKAKQYYAQAGMSDSSMANDAIAQIEQQATTMHEQARQNLLQAGINTLNITDKYQQAAVGAEMSADQNAGQLNQQFLSTYGQWMRQLPVTSNSGSTTTPATTTTPQQ